VAVITPDEEFQVATTIYDRLVGAVAVTSDLAGNRIPEASETFLPSALLCPKAQDCADLYFPDGAAGSPRILPAQASTQNIAALTRFRC
jgi:hypothetical protein